jgi:hypothetical protein
MSDKPLFRESDEQEAAGGDPADPALATGALGITAGALGGTGGGTNPSAPGFKDGQIYGQVRQQPAS